MKHVVFLVDETKSYVKWPLAHDLKPNVTAPLIVPLHEGGTITLTIEETKHVAHGFGEYLWFTTDKLDEDSTINSTGNLQAFRVLLSGLSLQYHPKTGAIGFGTATLFVIAEPYLGGAGAWNVTSLTAPSAFIDQNSPHFDFSNGLGCGGGVRFELGTGNDPAGNFFVLHIEGKVSMEDVDGDGDFEVVCRGNIKHKLWLEKKTADPAGSSDRAAAACAPAGENAVAEESCEGRGLTDRAGAGGPAPSCPLKERESRQEVARF